MEDKSTYRRFKPRQYEWQAVLNALKGPLPFNNDARGVVVVDWLEIYVLNASLICVIEYQAL